MPLRLVLIRHAETLWNRERRYQGWQDPPLSDTGRAQALAAGTTPAARVHPEVVDVMREVGLDLSQARPQLLTTDLAAGARHLVTMGCGEECPYLPGLEVRDWALDDPKGQPIQRVREIRDEVRRRVEGFVNEHGWSGKGVQ